MTTESEKQNNQLLPTSNEEIVVTSTSHSPLSASILDRIETEHVVQVPRWQFLIVEYGIWVLWLLSVLFGAIAFSVMLFFMTHAGFALYEATHETFFDFVLDVLPLAWIAVFVLMALFAYFNLRHTKHGYRYKLWQVLLSSIVGSFLGGIVLHMVGMSFLFDDFMNKQVPMFGGLQAIETRMWQKPKEGRIIGKYSGVSEVENVVLFTDNQGALWHVHTGELNARDLDNLYDGMQVRVLGVPSSTNPSFIQGCGVFPLRLEKDESLKELRTERDMFLARMKEHHKSSPETVKQLGVRHLTSESLCEGQSAVLRIKHKLMAQ